MKVLLDHCTPAGLRHYMPEHEVRVAAYEGWDRISNGELIRRAAEAGYTVLVTADKKMLHQQNIDELPLGIVVLTRPKWEAVKTRIPSIRRAVAESKRGQIARVVIPLTPDAPGTGTSPPTAGG